MLDIKLSTHDDMLKRSCGLIKSGSKVAKYNNNSLYSTKIFGSGKAYQCDCIDSAIMPENSPACEVCGVPYLPHTSRSTRMAHIPLPFPIVNPLFFGEVADLLGIKRSDFIEGITGRQFFIIDEGMLTLGGNYCNSLNSLLIALENTPATWEYMLSVVPVLPPNLRADGEQSEDSVNIIYKAILQAAELLSIDVVLPASIHAHECLLVYIRIQHIVAFLFDTTTASQLFKHAPLFGSGATLSRIDHKGILNRQSSKLGRFRANLLGKRVDFSARTVHNGERTPDIDTAIIPIKAAMILFKPQIIGVLSVDMGIMSRYDAAKQVDARTELAETVLYNLVENQLILVNRAPTLHMASLRAFYIKLHRGNGISLPHLVYGGLCLDSDGDTLAMHLPTTATTQQECIKLLPSSNLYSQRDGSFAYYPSHECLAGITAATIIDKSLNPRVSKSYNELHRLVSLGVCYYDTVVMWWPRRKLTTIARLFIEQVSGVEVEQDMRDRYGRDYLSKCAELGSDIKAVLAIVEDIGYAAVHEMGLSVKLDDLKTPQWVEDRLVDLDSLSVDEQNEEMDKIVKEYKRGQNE